MGVHLIKLCVGAGSVADLACWQKERLAVQRKAGGRPQLFHMTRHAPKRRDELLGGGSLYWVINGVIALRQRIAGFDEGRKSDGTPCCLILLHKGHHLVRPTPRRPFQGWRYLEAADAPPDLTGAGANRIAELPHKMRKDLAELGLI